MSVLTHQTERLHSLIRKLKTEYEQQEELKIIAYKALLDKFELAQQRIIELESQIIKV